MGSCNTHNRNHQQNSQQNTHVSTMDLDQKKHQLCEKCGANQIAYTQYWKSSNNGSNSPRYLGVPKNIYKCPICDQYELLQCVENTRVISIS